MALSDTLKAISDPVRREILELLKKERKSAGEIAQQFQLTNATVSYHLSQLKKANLVTETREKKYVYYELNVTVFEEVLTWIYELGGKKMKHKIKISISIIICLLPMIAGVIFYHQLPDRMPIHFGINDVPDNYASKGFALFGIPILLAVVQSVIMIATYHSAKEKEYETSHYFLSFRMASAGHHCTLLWINAFFCIGIHGIHWENCMSGTRCNVCRHWKLHAKNEL